MQDWWTAPINKISLASQITGSGIYVFENTNQQIHFGFNQSHISILIPPEFEVSEGDVGFTLSTDNNQFIWLEGKFRNTANHTTMQIHNSSYITINASEFSGIYDPVAATNTNCNGISTTQNINGTYYNHHIRIYSTSFNNFNTATNLRSSDFNTIYASDYNSVNSALVMNNSNDNLMEDLIMANGGQGISMILVVNETIARNIITNVRVSNFNTGMIINGESTLLSDILLSSNGRNIQFNSDSLIIQNSTIANSTDSISIGNGAVFNNVVFANNATAVTFSDSNDYLLSNVAVVDGGDLLVNNTALNFNFQNNLLLGNNSLCQIQTGAGTFIACNYPNIANVSTPAFIAKATTDSNNLHGATASVLFNNMADWIQFDDGHRNWGLSGSAYPNANHRGRCTTADTLCKIWDWSLDQQDTVLRNRHNIPNGDNFLRFLNQPSQSNPAFLLNATEILHDGIGNDNTLCESDEHCLFSPHIGKYQGHGNLVIKQNADQFQNGTLSNITLWEYQSNQN